MKTVLRSCIAAAGATLALVSAIAPSARAAYPEKAIRIIVPFAPGGGTSNAARMVGEKLTEKWGQPVIVDNRPGGNTIIGAEAAVKAAPDGYTLFFANSSFAINPSLMSKMPYDSVKDFAPITPILVNPFMVMVHPNVPARTLADLVKLLKAEPEKWPAPSVGGAGIGRLANEVLFSMIGVKLVNVPYKGTSQLATDLLAGQVRFAVEIPGVYIPHIKAGKLRPLAVTGKTRLAVLPDVPTFAEAGLPDYNVSSWYGLMGQAAMPREIINQLNAAVQEIIQTAPIRQRMAAMEAEPLTGTPAEFGAMIRADMERFARVIRAAGIEATN